MKLSRSFYQQATIDVAKQLLGKYLVRRHNEGPAIGRIVETEAYIGPQDLACHASKGRTPRTEVMFGPAGRRVCLLYLWILQHAEFGHRSEGLPGGGIDSSGGAGGGIELMKEHRKSALLRNLASGPGKLCQAFAVDRSLNGANLSGDILYVEDRGETTPKFMATPRIGVDYAGKWKTSLTLSCSW